MSKVGKCDKTIVLSPGIRIRQAFLNQNQTLCEVPLLQIGFSLLAQHSEVQMRQSFVSDAQFVTPEKKQFKGSINWLLKKHPV